MAKIPEYPRSHCYFRCDEGGPLHHFPKPHYNPERFAAWKSVLCEEIREKGDKYIHNTFRLCNKHFEKYYILESKQLTRNSVPTLHLEFKKEANSEQNVLLGTVEANITTSHHEPATTTTIQQTTSILAQEKKSMPVKRVANPKLNLLPATVAANNTTIHPGPATSTTIRQTTSRISQKKKSMQGVTNESHNLKMIEKLNKKIMKLTQKSKCVSKRILAAKKLSEQNSFLKTIDSMPDSIQTFIKMQIKSKQKPKGRKFTLEEKIMATAIWKQSQKGYNYLSKLIILPSKRTLQRFISTFRLKPGINEKIMRHIKHAMKKMAIEKRLYTLLFDEVALAPGLYFNENEIIGFEDLGNIRNKNIADHALVIMIKGIKTKTKQPILFHFCKSSTKKIDLKTIIITTIEKLSEAGVIIISTICDQATSNVSAIKLLQKETKEKYLKRNVEFNSNAFEIKNNKIFPLFDTPHLLKGVRNNFMTKNIKFIQDNKEKIAKWEHLRKLLEIDTGEDEIRILTKLTEYHVDPAKVPKMKVKYAAQVFSQRVSAVIRFLSKNKIIPKECEDTADILLIFDKLFDSFNGHLYHDTAKVLKGCIKNNSPHFNFWNEMLPILKSICFEKIVKNPDGSYTKKYEKVPSIQNWVHNINSFSEMWSYIHKKYKVRNILTRNFNQDPLENFFCCIRSNGIRNINPTCLQFVNAYKTLLLNNLNSPHSISANCEKDDYKPLQSMNFLLSQKCETQNPDFACEIDSLITAMNEIVSSTSLVHEESKNYVAGYVIKKCKSAIFKGCKQCYNDLVKTEINPDSLNYMIDYTKKSLFNANNSFFQLLNEIYYMIVTCLRESPEINYLKQKIIFCINCRCDFSLITCTNHKSDLCNYIINLSLNLIVNSWCKGVNRILIGKIISFDQNDKIKLQAHNYYKSHRKQRNKLNILNT